MGFLAAWQKRRMTSGRAGEPTKPDIDPEASVSASPTDPYFEVEEYTAAAQRPGGSLDRPHG